MNKPRLSTAPAVLAMTAMIAMQLAMTPSAIAQYDNPVTKPVKVDRNVNRVELISRTSRLLQFDYNVPELVVDNQNVVRATPIAADQVLLTALKPGIATITVSDPDKQIQTINVLVTGDVRTLEMTLQQIFPHSRIRATALETGVVLSGTLSRADQVPTVLNVASEYFPQVHNNLQLPNSQLIAIEVQIYEVARTKVRELGIDWQISTSDFDLTVTGAANPENTIFFSVVNNGDSFTAFLQALERRSLARLLDRPTLITMNGRPAEFLEGGELPFEINQGLGNTTIEFKPFGTKLDVVPIVQGEGTVRLEVRAEVSEPSADLANNTGTAGFRVRRVNTGVDMKIGHTLALAGDIREETESETRGIPGLMNTPYLGAFFRRVEERTQEIELVILLTPRFIGEMDPALMPPGGPGRNSVSPSDCQLYHKGYLEVPRCNQDCGTLPYMPQDPIPGQIYPPSQLAPGFSNYPQSGGPTPAVPASAITPNGISPTTPQAPATSPITSSATSSLWPKNTSAPQTGNTPTLANPVKVQTFRAPEEPTTPQASSKPGYKPNYDWISDPSRVESREQSMAGGFGYPAGGNQTPKPEERTASQFSLKNLFKR